MNYGQAKCFLFVMPEDVRVYSCKRMSSWSSSALGHCSLESVTLRAVFNCVRETVPGRRFCAARMVHALYGLRDSRGIARVYLCLTN